MSSPWLLDLFCCQGGAARGYAEAGFSVVGVDVRPQPRYPFRTITYDALLLDPLILDLFDAIHASPPCQFGTSLRHAPNAKRHFNLIPETRAMLEAWSARNGGRPWVIENVDSDEVRPHMPGAVTLTGGMFRLGVNVGRTHFHLHRPRLFQFSGDAPAVDLVDHRRAGDPIIGIYGGHVRCRSAAHGGRGTVDFVGEDRPRLAASALGLPPGAMTMDGMSQCVPPPYARWAGRRLMERLA